jgi:hypothetical protein
MHEVDAARSAGHRAPVQDTVEMLYLEAVRLLRPW